PAPVGGPAPAPVPVAPAGPVPVAPGSRAGAGQVSPADGDEQRGRQGAFPGVPAGTGAGEHR
ncbi:hypothetical protein V6V16_14620, partial [Micromonospora sp. CPCC 205561]